MPPLIYLSLDNVGELDEIRQAERERRSQLACVECGATDDEPPTQPLSHPPPGPHCSACFGRLHQDCAPPCHPEPVRAESSSPLATLKNSTRLVCSDCAQCLACGSRSPGPHPTSTWYGNGRVCTPCYEESRRGRIGTCAECGLPWAAESDRDVRDFTSTPDALPASEYMPTTVLVRMLGGFSGLPMIQCDLCDLWVHAGCDGITDVQYQAIADAAEKYCCPSCRRSERGWALRLAEQAGVQLTPVQREPVSDDLRVAAFGARKDAVPAGGGDGANAADDDKDDGEESCDLETFTKEYERAKKQFRLGGGHVRLSRAAVLAALEVPPFHSDDAMPANLGCLSRVELELPEASKLVELLAEGDGELPASLSRDLCSLCCAGGDGLVRCDCCSSTWHWFCAFADDTVEAAANPWLCPHCVADDPPATRRMVHTRVLSSSRAQALARELGLATAELRGVLTVDQGKTLLKVARRLAGKASSVATLTRVQEFGVAEFGITGVQLDLARGPTAIRLASAAAATHLPPAGPSLAAGTSADPAPPPQRKRGGRVSRKGPSLGDTECPCGLVFDSLPELSAHVGGCAEANEVSRREALSLAVRHIVKTFERDLPQSLLESDLSLEDLARYVHTEHAEIGPARIVAEAVSRLPADLVRPFHVELKRIEREGLASAADGTVDEDEVEPVDDAVTYSKDVSAQCVMCQRSGDRVMEGRLLPVRGVKHLSGPEIASVVHSLLPPSPASKSSLNRAGAHPPTYVHARCALVLPELTTSRVVAGAGREVTVLSSVGAAVSRSRRLRCLLCNGSRASVDCHSPNCKAVYHLDCSIKGGGRYFMTPGSAPSLAFMCPAHADSERSFDASLGCLLASTPVNRPLYVVEHTVQLQPHRRGPRKVSPATTAQGEGAEEEDDHARDDADEDLRLVDRSVDRWSALEHAPIKAQSLVRVARSLGVWTSRVEPDQVLPLRVGHVVVVQLATQPLDPSCTDGRYLAPRGYLALRNVGNTLVRLGVQLDGSFVVAAIDGTWASVAGAPEQALRSAWHTHLRRPDRYAARISRDFAMRFMGVGSPQVQSLCELLPTAVDTYLARPWRYRSPVQGMPFVVSKGAWDEWANATKHEDPRERMLAKEAERLREARSNPAGAARAAPVRDLMARQRPVKYKLVSGTGLNGYLARRAAEHAAGYRRGFSYVDCANSAGGAAAATGGVAAGDGAGGSTDNSSGVGPAAGVDDDGVAAAADSSRRTRRRRSSTSSASKRKRAASSSSATSSSSSFSSTGGDGTGGGATDAQDGEHGDTNRTTEGTTGESKTLDVLEARGTAALASHMYRTMQAKNRAHRRVIVGRSRIAGMGAFACAPLREGEFIAEYTGEVVRQRVADRREVEYDEKGLGTYMFRIDDDSIVDATLKGADTRFINHCCDPNCVTTIRPIQGSHRIIVVAKRDIPAGTELSYDYQFQIEGDEDKLECHCGAPNCVGYMN